MFGHAMPCRALPCPALPRHAMPGQARPSHTMPAHAAKDKDEDERARRAHCDILQRTTANCRVLRDDAAY
eukprot:2410298-Alexandrium_andersonii.AAC.1